MKKKFLFVAATCISSTTILAQDSASYSLDAVVVTANKYPQKQSSTGKVLTVINRTQLENNTGRTLAQVLNEQAGIIINGSQNTLGTNQTVFLRGANAANTLILVDGMPASDASGISNEFDLNHFSIDQIERVEILKGSQSVLYGSDAMAGVINIITKKQAGKKTIGLQGTAAAGSYSTFKGTAGIGGALKQFSYNVQYSRLQSDGFSSAQDITGKNNFDKDGFSQDVLGIHAALQATKNWNIRAFAQAGKYKAGVDDAPFIDDKTNNIENKNLQVGLSSVNNFKEGSLTVNLNLNTINRYLNDERIPGDPNDDSFTGTYKGKAFFAEAFTNINLQQHIGLLIGTDMRNQKATIETFYSSAFFNSDSKLGQDSLKATQVSGYLSLLLKSLGGFNTELGGRYTHHSQFGGAFTFSINPSYLINKQVKIFANIATGFRAPSLYNLASEYGNKNLQPEKSASYEGGLQYGNTNNTLNIRAAYFYRVITDVIVFNALPVPPYAQYGNANKQKDNGFELEATIRPSQKITITANYAFVDGKIDNFTGSASGKDTSFYNLYRRPKNCFNTTIGYKANKKLYLSLGGRWVDKRTDLYVDPITFTTEKKNLKAYYNLDVFASYQVVKFIKVFIDLRNVTNQEYVDLYGYNSRKFNFMAGFAFNF
jgi:vitamin B12 transporter